MILCFFPSSIHLRSQAIFLPKFLIVLVSISIYANEPIYLSYIDKGENIGDERSLSIVPTASHDGNVITIYSEKTLEGVGIYVVDAQGVILYSAEESALLGNYTFALDGHPKGTLMLVIQTNEEYYEGEFSLE